MGRIERERERVCVYGARDGFLGLAKTVKAPGKSENAIPF